MMEEIPGTLSMSQIGRLAGVGRAAIKQRIREHGDLAPVAGSSEVSPRYPETEARAWVERHFPRPEPQPQAPAVVTLADGRTLTLHSPSLTAHGETEDLGGYVERGGPRPSRTGIARAQVPGHEPFAVGDASLDCGYAASAQYEYVSLLWRVSTRSPLTDKETI
ncbi:hypothetical protein [Streptomyces acidiscabies]|uniref:hypothetical protein n=1 Tax=Streptomyces acidiscabies TaxID=42234 RepID=UPI0013C53405|nr:hypothetical protein [Streptomyces acidiscabies]MBP5942573.1 hypothetical protein [Streptomyces sp. LBUM 1476]MBP5942613.1 hypothetical protein [Streptomyces sp. LBUM 1476]